MFSDRLFVRSVLITNEEATEVTVFIGRRLTGICFQNLDSPNSPHCQLLGNYEALGSRSDC